MAEHLNPDLLPGTLYMMILRALRAEPLHGYAIARRIKDASSQRLVIEDGSLYPALYRLERKGLIASEWGESENKRKAKYYSLTATGRKQLKAESESWNRFSALVAGVLNALPERS